MPDIKTNKNEKTVEQTMPCLCGCGCIVTKHMKYRSEDCRDRYREQKTKVGIAFLKKKWKSSDA